VKPKLTHREIEVLALVAEGKTNREAAELLYMSKRTVEWYLISIYRKLGVKNRTHACRVAIEQGVI
jgi:DNA-binding CsgD family transcriptional regulator